MDMDDRVGAHAWFSCTWMGGFEGLWDNHAWIGTGIKRKRGDGEKRMSMMGMEMGLLGILKT